MQRLISTLYTLALTCTLVAPVAADVYRYRTPEGRWVVTNTPQTADDVPQTMDSAPETNAARQAEPETSTPIAAPALSPTEKMHRFCADRWQADYRMQVYCRDQQNQGAERLQRQMIAYGIMAPDGTPQTSRQTPAVQAWQSCMARWRVEQCDTFDYVMVDYCLKEQMHALQQLGG